MNIKNYISKNAYKIPIYIFAFFTVLQCNTVFFNHSRKLILIFWTAFLFINLIQALSHLFFNKINILPLIKFEIIFLIISISYFFIEYLRYPFGIHYIFSYLIIPFILIIIFYDYILTGNIYELFSSLKNIVFILSCISLFFWIFSILGVPTNSNIFVTWGEARYIPGYFGLHFISQGRINFFGIDTVRNTGIFVEAPMYAYILVIALSILLFLNKKSKINKMQLIILLITILTTTSSGGIIFMGFVLIYYKSFLSKNTRSINLKVFLSLLLFLLFLIGSVYILKQKFVDSNWSASGSIRLDDIYAGFMAWKNNLLLGNGLGNYYSILQYMKYLRIVNDLSGYSIGIMQTLSFGGIGLLTFYIMPVFLSFKLPKRILGLSLASFGLFIIFIVNEVYIYIMIICFIYSAYILRKEKKV